MIKFIKKLFSRKKITNLFSNNEVQLAELGGNYCSDSC